MSTILCKNCVLSTDFPGVKLNAEGVCQHCASHQKNPPKWEEIRSQAENVIETIISKNTGSYDIVLAFSGGKDSTYSLMYLKKRFGCRILAFTIDNDFLSDIAYQNCRTLTANLGVDHIFFKPNPKAMMEIYNTSLKKEVHPPAALTRASSICASCIQVINTQIVNFATFYDIPIIAGGYIGGQVPSQTGFMKQNLRVTVSARSQFEAKVSSQFGEESSRLFHQAIGRREELTILNPMVYLNLSEERIVQEAEKVGWRKPKDTGKSSTNCLLNDYAIQQHKNQFRFHPYVFEIANSVRNGSMSRDEALKKIDVSFPKEQFDPIIDRLTRFE